jgi:hypothetical protein
MIFNYNIQIVLFILCAAIVIIFALRKRMAGAVIAAAATSRSRYCYLLLSLLIFLLGLEDLYRALFYQGYFSDIGLYSFLSKLLAALCFAVIFLTSRVHVGVKGISVPVFPFFLPRHKIKEDQIFQNTLTVRREGKKEFRIKLEPKDVPNLKKGLADFHKDRNTL